MLGKKTEIIESLEYFIQNFEEQKEENIKIGYQQLSQENYEFSGNKNLSYLEVHIIKCIGDDPQMLGIDIAKKMNLTRGGVSKIISRLEKKGFILTYQNHGNQKKIFIKLTKLGEKVYLMHKKLENENIKRMCDILDKFPEVEQATILKFLNALNGK